MTRGDRAMRLTPEGEVMWTTRPGEGAFKGDLLVSKTRVARVDLNYGQVAWEANFKAPYFGPEVLPTCILVGDAGGLRALQAVDGTPLWEVKEASEGARAALCWQGVLLHSQGRLRRLGLTDGKATWTRDFPKIEGLWSSPDGSTVALVSSEPRRLLVLSSETGETTSETPLPSGKLEPLEWDKSTPALPVQGGFGPLWISPGQPPLEVDAPLMKVDGQYSWQGRLFADRTPTPAMRRISGDDSWHQLPGDPVHLAGDLLLCRTTSHEADLDATGAAIYDLLTDKPRPRVVEGYALVRLSDGQVVEQNPRAALAGTARTVKGLLTFMTQDHPSQSPGQLAPALPDPVLHMLDPVSARGWTLQQPFSTEWTSSGLDVVLMLSGHRLAWVDPGTKLITLSPALNLGEGTPSLATLHERLWVETGADYVYQLDSRGKLKAQVDFREGFLRDRLNNLISLSVLSLAIGGFILAARRKDLFIRRIPGLNAVEEAVGRATEMGQPILYVPGLEDIDETQTLAALSILSHVARKTAEYDSTILVPTRRSVVMSTAQEVVKEAYTAAGRPEAYHSENVRYLTDDQFGYVVGVDGMMLRERPAANFYLGYFYAESLILAETGFATGAIQIAGTAVPSQLPFFVATCDYTLIGEELYAASAYLSRDPLQVGSLRGQDLGKFLIMAAILAGALLTSCHLDFLKAWFET